MTFQFRCNSCDKIHVGIPTFGFDSPAIAESIPEDQREGRIDLGSDDCVIDEERFLIRGCLEISVHGEQEPFVWGVWVDISQSDYHQWIDAFHLDKRQHIGPFAGYLGSRLPCYPDTFNQHVVVHLRDNGIRPYIEMSQSEHLLKFEQRNGITKDRLAEIYEHVMHGSAASSM